MVNEDLLRAWAGCKAAKEESDARIERWEAWADGERAAHARIGEAPKGQTDE